MAATISQRDGAPRDVLVRLRADAPAGPDQRDALSGVVLDVTGVRAFDDRLERERALLRTTIDHMDQGLLVVEPDMSVPVLNHRVVELLRLPEAFTESRPSFPEILNYQYETGMITLETLNSSINTYILNREDLPEVHVYERETFDGATLEVRTTRLPGGGFVRTFTDQTARRRRDAEIARVHAEYRRLFENAVVGIYRALPDGRPVRANPAFARMNGYGSEAEMLAALGAADLPPEGHGVRSDDFLRRLRRDGLVRDHVSQISRRRTGELIWVSETAWAVVDDAGEMVAYEGTMVEATERKRAEDAVAHMARHDGLTGLPNRQRFVERLAALAMGGAPRLAVAFFDLDRFKSVNDTLGHPAGDAALCVLAARIAALVGPDDLVARFGGDEFAVVKLDAGRAEATGLAAAVLAAVRGPVRLENRDVVLGASVGIALAPRDGSDPVALMKCADVALYRAKAEGGDRWRFFEPEMAAEALERQQLEMDLRAGLDRDEFALIYQPLLSTETGRALGFEALLRWSHPERGPVGPDAFIGVAEATGLIAPLGAWVLERACADAAAWAEPLRLWVNVSAVQLADAGFEQTLARALASSGFPADRLVLEITETSLLDERADLAPRIARLRDLGVRTALDDFGTGYSSLGYLRRFAFDVIKIDRSFVQDLANAETSAIVMSVLELARRLELLVVAEGVETKAQLTALQQAGCGLVQGHLFGPPVDAATIAAGSVPRWDQG